MGKNDLDKNKKKHVEIILYHFCELAAIPFFVNSLLFLSYIIITFTLFSATLSQDHAYTSIRNNSHM